MLSVLFALSMLAASFGVLRPTGVYGEFMGNCDNITVNVTDEEVDRYGVCEPYQRLAGECNSIFSSDDLVYVPQQRVSGSQVVVSRLINEASIVILALLPAECLEVARKILCTYYFIPCGRKTHLNSTTVQERHPPVAVCSEQCFHLQNDLCPEQWLLAIEYFAFREDLEDVGMGLINCSRPGEILEPLPHCCTDAGITISSPGHEEDKDFVDSEEFLIAVCVGGGGCVVILVVVCAVCVVYMKRRKHGKRDFNVVGRTAYIPSNNSPSPSSLQLHPTTQLTSANTYRGGLIPLVQADCRTPTRRVPSTYLRDLSSTMLIPSSSISLLDTIGQGEFGVVYRAYLSQWEDVVSPVLVAVKTLKVEVSASEINELLEESVKMKNFDHPNILNLIGVCVDGGPSPYIVMPYMENGSLLSYLKRERPNLTIVEGADPELVVATQRKLLPMCLQIAKGMEYLASLKFVHRDLAARNCMIDRTGVIKVADFGLSEDIYVRNYFRQDKEGSGVKLPVRWMALESLHDGIFTEKSDVWSFGVTCWEVFSLGRTPYPGVDPFSLMKFLDRGERLDKPVNGACSEEIYSILLSCWRVLPDERPTFSSLVEIIVRVLESVAGYMDLNTFLEYSNVNTDKMTHGYDHLAKTE